MHPGSVLSPGWAAGGRKGFALLLVVVGLALLGALTLTAFGAGRREWRNAAELGFAAEAFQAAETGLAMGRAAAGGFAGAPVLVRQVGPSGAGARTRFTTAIMRPNPSLILVTSTGERLDGAGRVVARRVLALVGKLVPPAGGVVPRFEQLPERGWMQLYMH